MTKIVAVIAARMGSTRLPGKALMPILGKPMLERMIERVTHSKKIDEIILATTAQPDDDQLASFAERVGVECYRGAVDDVLGRINASIQASGADVAVELLGDNPLVHADLIDDVIRYYLDNMYDYVVNVTTEHDKAPSGLARFPIGIRVEAFSPAVLEKCACLASDPYHRENAASFIYQNPEIFTVGYYEAVGRWSDLNKPDISFAVNYKENFEMVAKIFKNCYPEDVNFDLFNTLEAFKQYPEFLDMMGFPARLRKKES